MKRLLLFSLLSFHIVLLSAKENLEFLFYPNPDNKIKSSAKTSTGWDFFSKRRSIIPIDDSPNPLMIDPQWNYVGPGIVGSIFAMEIHGNDLYVGGDFMDGEMKNPTKKNPIRLKRNGN